MTTGMLVRLKFDGFFTSTLIIAASAMMAMTVSRIAVKIVLFMT
jgi:hypothetical protein